MHSPERGSSCVSEKFTNSFKILCEKKIIGILRNLEITILRRISILRILRILLILRSLETPLFSSVNFSGHRSV